VFGREARTLIAADVLISTSREWTPEARATIDRRLAEAGAAGRAETVETPTMVRPADRSKTAARMSELRAIGPEFPLYGTLTLQQGATYSHAMLRDHGVLVRPELLTALGVVVGDEPAGSGPVLVPFAGAEHDWAAVELGAWLARARGVALQLAGATAVADGRDASRLLASASIAVQRALGVATEPVLVEPDPEALVDVAAGAGTIVVGLTDRWRREGLGRARTALATETTTPAVLVRRGVRPGGLAPRGTETRFTWTIAG